MNQALRECFVELYSQPILENLHTTLATRFPNVQFPPVPQRGDLGPSTYFACCGTGPTRLTSKRGYPLRRPPYPIPFAATSHAHRRYQDGPGQPILLLLTERARVAVGVQLVA